jgi:hypothetical protein
MNNTLANSTLRRFLIIGLFLQVIFLLYGCNNCEQTHVQAKTTMDIGDVQESYSGSKGSLWDRVGKMGKSKVLFSNKETLQEYPITADKEGNFEIVLPKGSYRVTVNHDTIGKYQFDVAISGCNQKLDVGNFMLDNREDSYGRIKVRQ